MRKPTDRELQILTKMLDRLPNGGTELRRQL